MLLAGFVLMFVMASAMENPSALLDKAEYQEATSHRQLVCPVKYVIEQQGRVRTRTLFYPMADVAANMTRYAHDQLVLPSKKVCVSFTMIGVFNNVQPLAVVDLCRDYYY